jgi:hypothetical protein
MEHTHSVIDKDRHFVIDGATMKITCEEEPKALRCGDHASERYSFSMPRVIEGHDMSLCNKVEAHYNNEHYDSKTRETTINRGFAEVEDFGVSSDSEDTVVWTWLVKDDATQLDGILNFSFLFECINEKGVTEYRKLSEPFESIKVGKSINNRAAIPKEYPDIIAQFEKDIAELKKGGATDEQIKAAIKEYLAENGISAEDIGAVSKEELKSAVDEALKQAKESGEFNGKDGVDGKDGQDGADGNDYVLTEADKIEIAEQAAKLVDTALLSIIGEVSE